MAHGVREVSGMTALWIRDVVGLGVSTAVVLAAGVASSAPLLARVDLDGPLTSFPLRVHAHLRDASGAEYVLVSATAAELASAGRPHRVLAADAPPRDFVLASPRTPAAMLYGS